jgi:tagaturonate epimerase
VEVNSFGLSRFSIGIGDRFGLEGEAQLRALKKARDLGVDVTPVWNKSNREHTLIGTEPATTRTAASHAVANEGWTGAYFVDADHIGLKTVDRFLDACDFFTLDVADFIGKAAPEHDIEHFVDAMGPFTGDLRHPMLDGGLNISADHVRIFARRYLYAIQEASKIFTYVRQKKGNGKFITEVSVDEAYDPQSPVELYLFLAGLSRMGISAQTVAPKFSGKFLKGIDYVGDVEAFSREFKADLAVVSLAIDTFKLPKDLKLSVHSGSDKFALYPRIHSLMKQTGTGVHLKTAGTTWLEEVIGLAAEEATLPLVKRIYSLAFDRFDELRKPYETVVEIEQQKLPLPSVVNQWSASEFVGTLKHEQGSITLDRNFRQFVHIAFRVAAEMGDEFRDSLLTARASIEENVTYNLYARHIMPLFVGS